MADNTMFKKNYYFYGKHQEMVTELVGKIDEKSGASIFNSNIDLMIFAALYGVRFNLKSTPSSDKSKHTVILAEQFNTNFSQLSLAFKIVALLGDRDVVGSVERLNNTFRKPEDNANYDLFEKYVLGGIEDIYDKLMVTTNKDFFDYYNSVNKLLSSCKLEEQINNTDIDTSDLF